MESCAADAFAKIPDSKSTMQALLVADLGNMMNMTARIEDDFY